MSKFFWGLSAFAAISKKNLDPTELSWFLHNTLTGPKPWWSGVAAKFRRQIDVLASVDNMYVSTKTVNPRPFKPSARLKLPLIGLLEHQTFVFTASIKT